MTKREKEAQKLKELEETSRTATALQADYLEELNQNPKYSLIVDPENLYAMPEEQRLFIKYYVDYKNVGIAADLANIDIVTARSYFTAYSTQQEIRRLNMALCHRQFETKLATIDEIGGWLTSMLTETNVAQSDRPSIGEKLRIAQMIIDLNKYRIAAMVNPEIVMKQDLETDIRKLSVASIKQLLEQADKPPETSITSDETMTMEEAAYLETLSTKDLLDLVNKANEGDKK